MKKERTVKISNVVIIVATTAFVMTLIYGYIIKKKEEKWLKRINSIERFETIKTKNNSDPIDSIYYKKDTTFYYKNDSLVGFSVRTEK